LTYEAWYLKILIGSTVRSLTPPLSGNMVWHWLKLLRSGAEIQGMGPAERAATPNELRRPRLRRRWH
jgi:hypothetical protein